MKIRLLRYLVLFLFLLSSWANAEQMKEVKATYQGLTVNGNLVMSDDKTFKDGIALIVHGTLANKDRSTYVQLQKNLAALGVNSLAINLSLNINDRHGDYDCHVLHHHKHSDALKEIDFWLKWLKKQGANQVVLMGHSRGGSQAAWYAVKHDNPLVKAVVLLAPATREQQSAKKYEHKYGKPLSEPLNQAKSYLSKGEGDKVLHNTDFIYCKKVDVTAASFVDYYKLRPEFDTPTLLQKIKKSTLVIMGTEDQVVPDLPDRMKEVNSKWVKVITIEDADHSFLDFASEDTAQAIADFIQQVLHK